MAQHIEEDSINCRGLIPAAFVDAIREWGRSIGDKHQLCSILNVVEHLSLPLREELLKIVAEGSLARALGNPAAILLWVEKCIARLFLFLKQNAHLFAKPQPIEDGPQTFSVDGDETAVENGEVEPDAEQEAAHEGGSAVVEEENTTAGEDGTDQHFDQEADGIAANIEEGEDEGEIVHEDNEGVDATNEEDQLVDVDAPLADDSHLEPTGETEIPAEDADADAEESQPVRASMAINPGTFPPIYHNPTVNNRSRISTFGAPTLDVVGRGVQEGLMHNLSSMPRASIFKAETPQPSVGLKTVTQAPVCLRRKSTRAIAPIVQLAPPQVRRPGIDRNAAQFRPVQFAPMASPHRGDAVQIQQARRAIANARDAGMGASGSRSINVADTFFGTKKNPAPLSVPMGAVRSGKKSCGCGGRG